MPLATKQERQDSESCQSEAFGGRVWTDVELATVTDGTLLMPGLAGPVCTDSRKLQAGDWFLALQGERFDGVDFIWQALERGCGGAIVSEEQLARVRRDRAQEKDEEDAAAAMEAGGGRREGEDEGGAEPQHAGASDMADVVSVQLARTGAQASSTVEARSSAIAVVGSPLQPSSTQGTQWYQQQQKKQQHKQQQQPVVFPPTATPPTPQPKPPALTPLPSPLPGWSAGLLVVPACTLRALHCLASQRRAELSAAAAVVVAVTGSVGKTSSRRLMALALRALGGHVHETSGNLNNHIGVPLTLLAAPPSTSVCVLELGMSAAGEIDLLASLSLPSVRVLLNVGAAHLDSLGSLEAVAAAKGELLASARPSDVCVLNCDDARVMGLATGLAGRKVTFGTSASADVRLLSCQLVDGGVAVEAVLASSSLPAGTSGDVEVREETARLRLSSPGLHLGMNAAAAAAVAVSLGVPLSQAVAHMAAYEPVGMRMRLERIDVAEHEEGDGDGAGSCGGGSSNSGSKDDDNSDRSSNSKSCILLLNDAYNANPLSMAAALRQLAGMQPGISSSSGSSSVCEPMSVVGRRIAVVGDMRELGDRAQAEHRRAIETAAWLGIDEMLLVGPSFQQALASLAPHMATGGNEDEGEDAPTAPSPQVPSQSPVTDAAPCTVYLCQQGSTPPTAAAPAAGSGKSGTGLSVCWFASVDRLVDSPAVRTIAAGDVVLVKGSRAMRMERVMEALMALHSAEKAGG